MSLIDDLDDSLWCVRVDFSKALKADEWLELYQWCNIQFGKDGWQLARNIMRFKKEEHATMFLLRWC